MLVGILALQGSFVEHAHSLELLNVPYIYVKTIDDLNQIDGLIIPGGESTVISKLLKIFDLFEPLKEKIIKGMPVYGTCAGLIVLAKNIIGENPHLGVMDITVRRNAYGAQISSFSTDVLIKEFSDQPIPLVFIRAPWIESVENNVNVILELDGRIVCARQENILVSSFHPELTEDVSVHKYFIEMIKNRI